MGVALALTLGAAGVASAQSTDRPERPRSAQQDGGERRGPGGPGGERGRGGPDAMLLRGITLSADQQAQVQSLRERQRAQMEAGRAQGAERRAPRERGDTTGLGARRAEMEQRREQHAAALRSILTDEQRTQFDRNVAQMRERAAERGRDGGARAGRGRGGDREAARRGA